jgi:hypothetical protein
LYKKRLEIEQTISNARTSHHILPLKNKSNTKHNAHLLSLSINSYPIFIKREIKTNRIPPRLSFKLFQKKKQKKAIGKQVKLQKSSNFSPYLATSLISILFYKTE